MFCICVVAVVLSKTCFMFLNVCDYFIIILYLCGIFHVLIEWRIDGLLLCRSARCS